MPYSVSLTTGNTLNPDPQLGNFGQPIEEKKGGRDRRDTPVSNGQPDGNVLRVSVEEIRFAQQGDPALWKCGIRPNPNPAFWPIDDDLLPNVAVEHTREFFIKTTRLKYWLECGSRPISWDARFRVLPTTFYRSVRDGAPVRIGMRD